MTRLNSISKPSRTVRIAPIVRKRAVALAPHLEEAFQKYHRSEYLGSDPLALAHEWTHPEDQELVALLAALLAYGQVGQAVLSVRRVLERLDGQPSAVVASESFEQLAARMAGWRHRVTSGQAMALLLWLVGQARKAQAEDDGTNLVSIGDGNGGGASGPTSRPNAADLIVAWRTALTAPATQNATTRAILESRDFRHLLPDPARGSACKRLMLFLRWMVRPADGVDLGLWYPGKPVVLESPMGRRNPIGSRSESQEGKLRPRPKSELGLGLESDSVHGLRRGVLFRPADLLMPVDTHVLRIAVNLGLLPDSAPANLATAQRLTAVLRLVDPEDPVRFDFALCRLGILQACPTRERLAACEVCGLRVVCLRRRRMG